MCVQSVVVLAFIFDCFGDGCLCVLYCYYFTLLKPAAIRFYHAVKADDLKGAVLRLQLDSIEF